MSADNAYFVYQDQSEFWRVKHGFASDVPDCDTTDELEEFFADAWGHLSYDEALAYAHECVRQEQVCEYGVWIIGTYRELSRSLAELVEDPTD